MSYRVLIACEESQTECIAFRNVGCEAYSCDLQKCSGGHPEWHICDDVLNVLYDNWDLVIAHPPCTYLARSGVCNFGRVGQEHRAEYASAARSFFMRFYDYGLNGRKIAIENPVPASRFQLPVPTQFIEPYYFGDPYSKKTALWIHNLPPLIPTLIDLNFVSFTSLHRTSKQRSKAFPGIASAMAHQWSFF